MTPRLFVGVHHNDEMTPVILGTQAALAGGWVVGPRYPATHAFVVVEAGGLAWRLDGQPPHSLWEPCLVDSWELPTALWEVVHGDVLAGVVAARALRQVPYGWDEILMQARHAADAAAAKVLTSWVRLSPRWSATRDRIHHSMICSRIALHCLRPTSDAARVSVDGMASLFPEACAKEWREAERDGWLDRVA